MQCEFARKAGLYACPGGPDGFKCVVAYVRVLEDALSKVLVYAEDYDPAEYGGDGRTQDEECSAARKLIETRTP